MKNASRATVTLPFLSIGITVQVITGDELQEQCPSCPGLPYFGSTGLAAGNSLGGTIPQSRRKVRLGGTTKSLLVGEDGVAVCLDQRQVLGSSSVCTSSVQDVRVDLTGQAAFIICTSGDIAAISTDTCQRHYYRRHRSPRAVLKSGSQHMVVFMKYGGLRRQPLTGGNDVILYTSTEITSTFGSCPKWVYRTYNDSHFALECPGTKRYVVSGFIKNQYEATPLGPMTINQGENEAVVRSESFITYYWNGFGSHCIINVPSSLPNSTLIDYAEVDGHTVIIIFTNETVFVYNTGRGCRDEYLLQLPQLTYPCIHGDCDGYYITEDGYLAIIGTSTSIYSLKIYDLRNVTRGAYPVMNLQSLPNAINVYKAQVQEGINAVSPSQVIPVTSSDTVSSMKAASSAHPEFITTTTQSVSLTSSVSSGTTPTQFSSSSHSTSSSSSISSTTAITSQTTVTPSATQLPSTEKVIPSPWSAIIIIALSIVILVVIAPIVIIAIIVAVSRVIAHRKGKDTPGSSAAGSVIRLSEQETQETTLPVQASPSDPNLARQN